MLETSTEIAELSAALSSAQGAMGSAKKGADNPFFKSKYADLSEVIKALKEPFADNGLSYTQFPVMDDDSAGVITVLMHSSGQYMRSVYTLPLVKRDAQSVGSCITYARRYALQAIAGIPAADDDGSKASEPLDPMAIHDDAVKRNLMSISAIKTAIEEQNWETVAECYAEMSNEDKTALWIAPSKGGVWTTAERTALKSDEFNAARKAMYGENK
jgi:hypothetical protein